MPVVTFAASETSESVTPAMLELSMENVTRSSETSERRMLESVVSRKFVIAKSSALYASRGA